MYMPKSIYSTKYKEVIEKLQIARKEIGLTQTDVARKLDKPQSYVSKIEKGERRIDITELMELAKIYNKPVNSFLTK